MQTRDNRREHLHQRVQYWSQRVKAEARVIRVQRMTRKWGSCSTAGTITLAEDLAEQEPGFQDFVIVHELLHLRVPTHGRLFKALMTAHVPAWRQYDIGRRSKRRAAASLRARVATNPIGCHLSRGTDYHEALAPSAARYSEPS
jgi:predicted metal-dependent hydrolase